MVGVFCLFSNTPLHILSFALEFKFNKYNFLSMAEAHNEFGWDGPVFSMHLLTRAASAESQLPHSHYQAAFCMHTLRVSSTLCGETIDNQRSW